MHFITRERIHVDRASRPPGRSDVSSMRRPPSSSYLGREMSPGCPAFYLTRAVLNSDITKAAVRSRRCSTSTRSLMRRYSGWLASFVPPIFPRRSRRLQLRPAYWPYSTGFATAARRTRSGWNAASSSVTRSPPTAVRAGKPRRSSLRTFGGMHQRAAGGCPGWPTHL